MYIRVQREAIVRRVEKRLMTFSGTLFERFRGIRTNVLLLPIRTYPSFFSSILYCYNVVWYEMKL